MGAVDPAGESVPSQSRLIDEDRWRIAHLAFVARPDAQRLTEHKYRCAQSLVFGAPVVALALVGHRLGGAEAAAWVASLQAILTGWVVYVASTGMLVDGLLRRRATPDATVAVVAVAGYLVSLICTIRLVVLGPGPGTVVVFQWVAALLGGWTGARWWWLARKATDRGSGKMN